MSNRDIHEYHVSLTAVKVRRICTFMGCDGDMVATGIMKTSHPPLYEHKCTGRNCVNHEDYYKQYPGMEYVEDERTLQPRHAAIAKRGG